jgi:hypothetical protein
MEKAKTVAVNILVIGAAALLLIWGDTWYRQHDQFDRGERASAAGDMITAISGYEAAIHMYTPVSGLVEESARKLWAIGEHYEQGGDQTRALIAYRALRSSFYAVRGLTAPGKDWIARCDGKIALLVQQQTRTAPSQQNR